MEYNYDSYLTFFIIAMVIICTLQFLFIIAYLSHILPKIYRKDFHIIPYWIDFGVLLFYTQGFGIQYLFYLVHLRIKVNNNSDDVIIKNGIPMKLEICQDSAWCSTSNFFLYGLYLLFGMNLLINSIETCSLCYTIKRVMSINARNEKELSVQFLKIRCRKVASLKKHFIQYMIVIVILGMYIGAAGVIYGKVNGSDDAVEILDGLTNKALVFYHLISIALCFISVEVLKIFKKNILENEYYTSNLTMQAQYNLNSAKVVFFSDFLTYKSIIDFFAVLPAFFFLMQRYLSAVSLILTAVVYAIYFFFTFVIYIYVDKTNKIKPNAFVRFISCFRRFRLNFGEKEKAKLFDEFLLDENTDETRDTDLNIMLEDANPLLEMSNRFSSTTLNSYQKCNLYVIFKLLYLFFKKNEEIFKDLSKILLEPKNAENIKYYANNNIEKSMKYQKDNFLDKENDNNFYEDMKAYYNEKNADTILNKKNDEDFSIKSYITEEIINLFPFYQFNIGDILKSLNPKSNLENIDYLYNLKKELKDKLNTFITFNRFLAFEIYDVDNPNEDNNNFISVENLKLAGKKYQAFIINEIVRKRKKTFLPSIIGIFNIKYYNYDKFIVLYRHPIMLYYVIPFNYASLFIINETEEKYFELKNNNNVLTEEELKKTIYLNEEDKKELLDIIESDFLFLRQLNFVSFFKFNLVAIKYDSEAECYDKRNNIENNENNNDNIIIDTTSNKKNDGDDEFNKFINKLPDMKTENDSFYLRKYEKFFFFDENSNKFIIKVYFSELFRLTIDPGFRESMTLNDTTNKTYCNFLKTKMTQLLSNKLTKSFIISE